MRRDLPPYYALAAMAVCLVLLAPQPAAAETPALRADQQRAIEAMLRDIDPAQRPFAQEQLAKTFAPMSETQVAMMSRIRPATN
jgi:hypothetical protein